MLNIARYAHKEDNTALYNNAAQSYNHAFYWACIRPKPQDNIGSSSKGGIVPDREKYTRLLELIDRDFGSYDKFRDDFVTAGSTVFGSGWVWLVHSGAGLEVWLVYIVYVCIDVLMSVY